MGRVTRDGKGRPHAPLLPRRPLPWPSTLSSSRHRGFGVAGPWDTALRPPVGPFAWFPEVRVLTRLPPALSSPGTSFCFWAGAWPVLPFQRHPLPRRPWACSWQPRPHAGHLPTFGAVWLLPLHSGSGGVAAPPPGAADRELQPKERRGASGHGFSVPHLFPKFYQSLGLS